MTTTRPVTGTNPRKTQRRGRPRSVFQAAQSGDDVQLLTALRDRIAKTLADPDTPARDLASLSKRLLEINGELKTAVKVMEEEAKKTRAVEAGDAGGDEAWSGV